MRWKMLFAIAACAATSLAAGCGSASSVAAGPPVTPGSPTPSPAATPLTVSVSALPTALPFTAGSTTGTVALPSAGAGSPSGATLTITTSTSAPNGSPALAAAARKPATAVTAAGVFVEIVASATITLDALPSFEFSTANVKTAGAFYIESFDPGVSPAAWQLMEGPGVIGNGIVTFPALQVPQTFAAGQTYVYALVQTGVTPVTVTPSSLSLLGTSPSDAAFVTVSESGYSGSFTMQSTCASVATIAASNNQYLVTPLAAGTCSATFTDAGGNTAVLPIVVTTTTGGGQ